MDRELPNIRAEVRNPSPHPAGSALKIVVFTATRTALATVQGAAHRLAQFENARDSDSGSLTGYTLQAIPEVP